MKLTRPSVSLVLLALTSACAADAESELVSGLDDLRFVDKEDEVCAPAHLVAYDPTGTLLCDSVGPWTGERLFPGLGVPSTLTHYCRFTYEGATEADAGALNHWLHKHFGADVELGADCLAVTPEGSASETALGGLLEEYFEWYSGRVVPAEIQAAYPNATPRRVDVAVVDTAPETIASQPVSDHGPIVTSLIKSFVCPPGSSSCPIQVETFLGLPRTVSNHHINTTRGGNLGLQSDLARGIFEALKDHEDSLADNLVINLSVAWEPNLFGGAEDVSELAPPVRAVYHALRYARCSGALILAAAGNSQGLDCDEGAMAPALWESQPAPIKDECIDEFGIATWAPDGNYTPLVYAVGGLRDDARKVSNGREFGTPRLAAAASHVFVERGLGMAEDEVRTGTSLATAVATATASLVWSYRPGLSPSQVMDRLYSSGTATSFTADFGLEGQQDAVVRVNACETINSAMGAHALPCGTQTVDFGDMADSLAVAPHTTDVYTTEFDTPEVCHDYCDNEYLFYPAPGDDRKCEEVERDPWDKLTAPQPIFGGCPDCLVEFHADGTSTAMLTIDDDYDGIEILGVDVQLYDAAGEAKTVALSEKEVAAGAVVEAPKLASHELRDYEIPLMSVGFVPVRANILITFDGTEQTLDPLIIAD